MKREQIEAIGNFLQYYYTDLNYINKFQSFKRKNISLKEYVAKEVGTFYSFLIEFRVARNFIKGSVEKLLTETIRWIDNRNADDVDLFVQRLITTNLTRGKATTSLASKILFLNNPWKIIPMDTFVRKVFKQNENKYSVYQENLSNYRKVHKSEIAESLVFIKPLTDLIHNDFKEDLKGLEIISENRMIDKLLWTIGK